MTEDKKTRIDTISERLKYIMQTTGIRPTDLARAINTKKQTVHSLCSQNIKKSRYYLPIANALNINITWLTTGKGEIFLKNDSKNPQMTLASNNEYYVDINALLKICLHQNTTSLPNVFVSSMPEDFIDPLIKKGEEIYIARILALRDYQEKDLIVLYNNSNNKILIGKIAYIKNSKYIVFNNQVTLKARKELLDELTVIGKIIKYSYTTPEYKIFKKSKENNNM